MKMNDQTIFKMKSSCYLLVVISVLTACSGPKPETIIDTYQGRAELKKNRPALAQDRFVHAITRDPFLYETNLNLGYIFENKDNEKNSEKAGDEKKEMSPETEQNYNNAIKSYLKAAELAGNDEQKFIAHFNLGETFGRLKNIEKALEHYQEALNIIPDSVETKTNIELLLQKQSGQGKGQSDKNDQSKDQNKEGQGQGSDQKKDEENKKKNEDKGDKKDDSSHENKEDKKDSDKDSKEKEKKGYGKSAKYQPRPFKGELPESELKKILNELKQQDQKIRAEYNRKEVKEAPRDKDW